MCCGTLPSSICRRSNSAYLYLLLTLVSPTCKGVFTHLCLANRHGGYCPVSGCFAIVHPLHGCDRHGIKGDNLCYSVPRELAERKTAAEIAAEERAMKKTEKEKMQTQEWKSDNKTPRKSLAKIAAEEEEITSPTPARKSKNNKGGRNPYAGGTC